MRSDVSSQIQGISIFLNLGAPKLPAREPAPGFADSMATANREQSTPIKPPAPQKPVARQAKPVDEQQPAQTESASNAPVPLPDSVKTMPREPAPATVDEAGEPVSVEPDVSAEADIPLNALQSHHTLPLPTALPGQSPLTPGGTGNPSPVSGTVLGSIVSTVSGEGAGALLVQPGAINAGLAVDDGSALMPGIDATRTPLMQGLQGQVSLLPTDGGDAAEQVPVLANWQSNRQTANSTQTHTVALDTDGLLADDLGFTGKSDTTEGQRLLSPATSASAGDKAPLLTVNLLNPQAQPKADQQFARWNVETRAGATPTAHTAGAAEASLAQRMQPQAEAQRAGQRTAVTVPFHQPNWGQGVGEKITWMVSQKLQFAEIQLDPPELGPLQVRISVQNDQVSVSFTSQHAPVREALDAHALRLRDTLESQGLNLVDVDVSDQGEAWREQDQEQSTASGGSPVEEEAGTVKVSVSPLSENRIDQFV